MPFCGFFPALGHLATGPLADSSSAGRIGRVRYWPAGGLLGLIMLRPSFVPPPLVMNLIYAAFRNAMNARKRRHGQAGINALVHWQGKPGFNRAADAFVAFRFCGRAMARHGVTGH